MITGYSTVSSVVLWLMLEYVYFFYLIRIVVFFNRYRCLDCCTVLSGKVSAVDWKYLRNTFPNVSDAKIKEGIFIGPQIRELMRDKQLDEDLKEMRGCHLRGFARTS